MKCTQLDVHVQVPTVLGQRVKLCKYVEFGTTKIYPRFACLDSACVSKITFMAIIFHHEERESNRYKI